MVFKSPAFIQREIEQTDELIRRAGYTGTINFRSSYGKKLLLLPLYLSRTGRDRRADGGTCCRTGPARLDHPAPPDVSEPDRVACGGSWDHAALRERGYRFATVSELLALR